MKMQVRNTLKSYYLDITLPICWEPPALETDWNVDKGAEENYHN